MIISTIDAYHEHAQPPAQMAQEPQQSQQPAQGDFQYVFQSQAPQGDVVNAIPMAIDPNVAAQDVAEDVSAKTMKNDRRHVCPNCSKRFNRPSSLKIHISTHTGERRESTLYFCAVLHA